MKKFLRGLLFVGLICLTVGGAFSLNTKNTYAETYGGTGATTPGNTGSTFNCYNLSNNNCPHWILAPIDTFKEAWDNRGTGLADKGNYDEGAYADCTDPSINTDGWVVFSGMNHNTSSVQLANILTTGSGGYLISPKLMVDRGDSSGWNYSYNYRTNSSGSIQNTPLIGATSSGLTYGSLRQEVLNQGMDPESLAFYCYGMVNVDITTTTDTVGSVDISGLNGMSYDYSSGGYQYYTASEASADLTFSYSVLRRDNDSNNPTTDIFSYGVKTTTTSNYTTNAVSLNQGSWSYTSLGSKTISVTLTDSYQRYCGEMYVRQNTYTNKVFVSQESQLSAISTHYNYNCVFVRVEIEEVEEPEPTLLADVTVIPNMYVDVYPSDTNSYDHSGVYYTFDTAGNKKLWADYYWRRIDFEEIPEEGAIGFYTFVPGDSSWKDAGFIYEKKKSSYDFAWKKSRSWYSEVAWDDDFKKQCAYYKSFGSNYTLENDVPKEQEWYMDDVGSDCIYIRGPRSKNATFMGEVRVSPASNLSGTVVTGRTNNVLMGNGLTSKFSITVTYRVQRTNNTPTYATSRFNFNSNNTGTYPPYSAYETDDLAYNEHDFEIRTYVVTVPIGYSTKKFCYNLSYDSVVNYRGDSAYSRDWAGRAQTCVTIANYPVSYTATYTGASNGYLLSHDQLSRFNSNKDGKINNLAQSVSDGKLSYKYPADSNYNANYTHRITRTGTTDPKFNIGNIHTYYFVEYCYNANCVDDGEKWSIATDRFGIVSISRGVTKSVGPMNNGTVFVSGYNQRGSYNIYCERMIYYSKVQWYTMYSSENNENSYKVSSPIYSGYSATDKQCVTLKNPRIEEIGYPDPDDPTSNIYPDPGIDPYPYLPSDPKLSPNYATHYTQMEPQVEKVVLRDGGNVETRTSSFEYDLNSTTPSLEFYHQITRNDATASFDESGDYSAGYRSVKFYPSAGTMYGKSAFDIATCYAGYYNGTIEAVQNITRNCTTVLRNATKLSLSDSAKLQLSTGLSSNNRSDKRVYKSSEDGEVANVIDLTGSVMKAGTSSNICRATYVAPYKWYTSYINVQYRERYTNVPSGFSVSNSDWISSRYFLISKKSNPVTTAGVNALASDQICVKVTRSWNFNVTEIKPSSAPAEDVVTSGQNVNYVFDVEVERDDPEKQYITDVNSTYKIIEYVVKDDVGEAQLEAKTKPKYEDYQGIGTNYCSFFSSVLDSNQCTVSSAKDFPSRESNDVSGAENGGVYTDTSYTKQITINSEVPTLPVGDKFCVAIVVETRSSGLKNGTDARISRSTCQTLSKNPTVHIMGGNVQTAGGIKTSRTDYNNMVYGSWTDLAEIARSSINNLASGMAIFSGVDKGDFPNEVFPLTMTNNNKNDLGNANVNVISGFNAVKGKYSGVATGECNLNGGSDISGYEYYYCSGNVTIRGNIELRNASITDPYDIPQVIIIADGNIKINENVTRIDAWLVSNGVVDTCADYTDDQLSSGVCTNKLEINGPITAQQVKFKRTGGADAYDGSLTQSAEDTDFSAATLVWAYGQSRSNAEPTVTYLQEIAPRY